ncbi:phosphoadenosine phosphosulfate reductase family protein [Thiomicrospira microaerophila]|uniref:phosphoadenosine phosphosulfate reductase family protein n=1 Tax=Thiomicrospira microaerophila TaxID=406020 RepID=UPI0005C8DE94|nr:phosphoadenosine phosphosulfate reductase family protein [Thiomicrospira microaerophila]
MEYKQKHVLGLSGGKDSAALAVYMRDNYPSIDIEYFFTDTGKELPETLDFLNELEAYLGKDIHRIGTEDRQEKDFDYLLEYEFNNYLPSPQQRWCTIQMKLVPFENWVKEFLDDGYEIFSYVAIRADEPMREGYKPTHDFLKVRMPFVEDGLIKKNIEDILETSGLGLPKYYEWRSRSGCTFCFFQRKIEWIRLKERHPELFEDAKRYEKKVGETPSGHAYYWLGKDTPLSTLENPEKIQQIKEEHEKQLQRYKKRLRRNALLDVEVLDTKVMDEMYDDQEGAGACITCYK